MLNWIPICFIYSAKLFDENGNAGNRANGQYPAQDQGRSIQIRSSIRAAD